MSFLSSLRAAFKGGAQGRVPLARNFVSPWQWAFERGGTRLPFEYRTAVAHAFLENPVAQRAVRIVADGVGCAPLAECDAKARALVLATSAGQPLLETLAAQLLLHGNAFVQIARDGGRAGSEQHHGMLAGHRSLLDERFDHAITGHMGHHQIQQHHQWLATGAHSSERRAAVGGFEHLISLAFEQVPDRVAQILHVVYDQYLPAARDWGRARPCSVPHTLSLSDTTSDTTSDTSAGATSSVRKT